MVLENKSCSSSRLLLRFLSELHVRAAGQLDLNTIIPEAVLAFLDHLERSRLNATRTRNIRLAAIRTFVRFVLGQSSTRDFLQAIRQTSDPRPVPVEHLQPVALVDRKDEQRSQPGGFTEVQMRLGLQALKCFLKSTGSRAR